MELKAGTIIRAVDVFLERLEAIYGEIYCYYSAKWKYEKTPNDLSLYSWMNVPLNPH